MPSVPKLEGTRTKEFHDETADADWNDCRQCIDSLVGVRMRGARNTHAGSGDGYAPYRCSYAGSNAYRSPAYGPSRCSDYATSCRPTEFVWKITGKPNPLSRPVGVAVDTDGNVYVVDTGNSRVQKFDRNGKFLMMWGTKGAGDGQFNITMPDEGRVAVDKEGNVYVADDNNYRVQKFDHNGKFLTKWGTQGDGDGQFKEISDIAIDQQNDVYVVDYQEDAVQKFDSDGRFLLRWGAPGSLDGHFNGPSSVAMDSQGNALVAELDSGRLQEFDGDGKFISKYLLQPVAKRLIELWNIALDGQGNIYIADHSAYRVVKVDRSGNFLAVWGSDGTGEGEFQKPQDIAVDKEGNVYVTDDLNNSVQKFRQPSYRP